MKKYTDEEIEQLTNDLAQQIRKLMYSIYSKNTNPNILNNKLITTIYSFLKEHLN